MANMKYYAHSLLGEPPEKWQELFDHLKNVAQLAKQFAEPFGAGDWAYLAGMWHDLGKYSEEFRDMIVQSNLDDAHIETKACRVDHSTIGAIHSVERFGKVGRALAYMIAGHHPGLADWNSEESGRSGLEYRLNNSENMGRYRSIEFPAEIFSATQPTQKPSAGSDYSLWIRMLFSCLVDADFIDTEKFMDGKKASSRGGYPSIESLLGKFNVYMEKKKHSLKFSKAKKIVDVNKIRNEILERCIKMGEHTPGCFTLTVPTGGGKTLSSMAFALNHALKYGKDRVVYVIPYTSIIEQTADEFRKIFGASVIEHHSNIDAENESMETAKSRIATENWDAPIIVTTSVQFFESLFSHRTSRCRKLHNVVNSVVVLDEAQLIPSEFLKPIVHVLKELITHYHVSTVLCTATQPALNSYKSVEYCFDGFDNVTEIITDPRALHERLKRVSLHRCKNMTESVNWNELAERLLGNPTVLCIVNRREDCRCLAQLLPDETYHLSALMCGQHRADVIKDIKNQLKAKIPIRVISTQLVEAGVDFDFPVVYRALAGLDSIAQAAGRCNREGELQTGHLFVFIPPSEIPVGHLRRAADLTRTLTQAENTESLHPEMFKIFFQQLFWLEGDRLDKKGIMRHIGPDSDLRYNFRTASQNFKIIDDSMRMSVFVPYKDGAKYIELLEKIGSNRDLVRKLQRYVVSIPRYLGDKLLNSGEITPSRGCPGRYIQTFETLYSKRFGFMWSNANLVITPVDLIA